jgi:hypothetical protein
MPKAAVSDSGRMPSASIAAAAEAVGRLALQFGLTPDKGKRVECDQAWSVSDYRRAPHQVRGNLFVCTVKPVNGPLEVRLAETLTTGWSPKADSLRRALADILSPFGLVEIDRTQ